MAQFGRYNLVRRIGTGGMAEIWKAKASGPAGFEKVLAIKKILPEFVEDGDFIDLFVEEAKLVAHLMHPNIVQVFDFGETEKGDYFIAMEYVAGPNLATMVRRLKRNSQKLPYEVALLICIEVLKAIGYAHTLTDESGKEMHIIHRDVSPQNILVSFQGQVKVTDFGIAKAASGMPRTEAGILRGKLSYMSPEQARLERLDHRTDLFSLGIILLELVTNTRMFKGAGEEIYERVKDFAGLTDADVAGLQPELQAILMTAMAPDAAHRYESAAAMEVRLTGLLGPDGIVSARRALAGLVRMNFEEELQVESGGTEDRESIELVATQSFKSDNTEISKDRSYQELQSEPNRPVTVPSDPDLSRPFAQPPSPPQVQAKGAPKKRRWAPIALGVISVLFVGAAGVLAGKLLPGATPVATSIDVAVTTPTAVAPNATRTSPKSTTTGVAVKKARGRLSVEAKPWVEVWLGKRRLATETPLRRRSLTVGKHRLTFKNARLGFSKTKVVEIQKGKDTRVFVDATTGKIAVTTR